MQVLVCGLLCYFCVVGCLVLNDAIAMQQSYVAEMYLICVL